jgi:hypothetical protein
MRASMSARATPLVGWAWAGTAENSTPAHTTAGHHNLDKFSKQGLLGDRVDRGQRRCAGSAQRETLPAA